MIDFIFTLHIILRKEKSPRIEKRIPLTRINREDINGPLLADIAYRKDIHKIYNKISKNDL
jgi:hypothetical protein